MLYFSYGSNMSLRRLVKRAPSVRKVAAAKLPGHKLIFHKVGRDSSGKCDAFEIEGPESLVRGVLFEIGELDKISLDREEGVGEGYAIKRVTVWTRKGENRRAFTYSATRIDETLKPYHWYKKHVLRGAAENDFPLPYLAMIEAVESIGDPDRARAERELGLYGEDPLRR